MEEYTVSPLESKLVLLFERRVKFEAIYANSLFNVLFLSVS